MNEIETPEEIDLACKECEEFQTEQCIGQVKGYYYQENCPIHILTIINDCIKL